MPSLSFILLILFVQFFSVPMDINAHGDLKESESKKQKRDVETHAEFESGEIYATFGF